jgi:hypothetical protein
MREAEHDVLLVKYEWDPLGGCGERDREADVPAHPHDDVGLHGLQDPARTGNRSDRPAPNYGKHPGACPVEAGYGDLIERKSGLDDHRSFDALCGADE